MLRDRWQNKWDVVRAESRSEGASERAKQKNQGEATWIRRKRTTKRKYPEISPRQRLIDIRPTNQKDQVGVEAKTEKNRLNDHDDFPLRLSFLFL